MRRSLFKLLPLVGAFILAVALFGKHHASPAVERERQKSPTTTVPVSASKSGSISTNAKSRSSTTLREVSGGETNVQQTVSAINSINCGSPAPVIPSALDGGMAHARDLMQRLIQLIAGNHSLTREQAREINDLLAQLVREGAESIPAIQDFMKQNLDYSYASLQGGELVNYRTLRLSLLDVLQQIGGPEAVELSVSTLQTTSDPLEIALLSRYLEQQVPGQYRSQELTAAREVLAQAASSRVPLGDMSPIFETMQALGDTNIVSDLEKAVQRWNYYATLALAGLSNGVGIPTLIKLAGDPSVTSMGSGDFALRPLAQVAIQYPQAAQALVDLANKNMVPDTAWPTVAASLAGSNIQYGNQLYGSSSPTPSWTEEQINQCIALINQLLSVTRTSAGRKALQDALASVSSRLPK